MEVGWVSAPSLLVAYRYSDLARWYMTWCSNYGPPTESMVDIRLSLVIQRLNAASIPGQYYLGRPEVARYYGLDGWLLKKWCRVRQQRPRLNRAKLFIGLSMLMYLARIFSCQLIFTFVLIQTSDRYNNYVVSIYYCHHRRKVSVHHASQQTPDISLESGA